MSVRTRNASPPVELLQNWEHSSSHKSSISFQKALSSVFHEDPFPNPEVFHVNGKNVSLIDGRSFSPGAMHHHWFSDFRQAWNREKVLFLKLKCVKTALGLRENALHALEGQTARNSRCRDVLCAGQSDILESPKVAGGWEIGDWVTVLGLKRFWRGLQPVKWSLRRGGNEHYCGAFSFRCLCISDSMVLPFIILYILYILKNKGFWMGLCLETWF